MSMPTPSACSVSFTVAELESYQTDIQTASDNYGYVYSGLAVTDTLRVKMHVACAALTDLIGKLETKIGQTGVLTPSGGTGKGV